MKTITMLQDAGVERARFEEIAEERLPGWRVAWATGGGPAAERARGADVVVTVNEPVGRDVLEAVRPRLVSISFTGTDHVDLEAARELGVAVTNVPSYATDSVAELAVCAVVALARRVVEADRAVREGRWREGLAGMELAGKTVGIVGTGRIGVAVARRLAPFGVRILGWSRSRPEAFEEAGGRHVELDTLLEQSDAVSLHVPLAPGTRGLVGARELGLMKPGALLVNTARGPVVDAAALADALERGRIGGAALDVHDVEPLPTDHPLRSAPRTILLPHVGFATREALDRKAVVTVENVRAFLGGERTNRVD